MEPLNIIRLMPFLFLYLFFQPAANAQYTVFNNQKDLWAWQGAKYLSVMWEPTDQTSEYNIYRETPGEDNPLRLNDEPLVNNSFIDRTEELSGDFEYFVVAKDPDGRILYRYDPFLITYILKSEDTNRSLSQNSATVQELREHITSDMEFRNYTSMSLDNIQNFLVNANSYLAYYSTQDAFGTVRPAAEIIYNSANDYGINPQAILTTLQKEQGLISTLPGEATQYQLDWAMGYAVGNENYRGFGNQVDRAAWQFDKYYRDMNSDGYTVSGWGISIPKETEDCLIVTPANMATAALYTYTPLAGVSWGGCTPYGGNFLYWDLFYNRYRFDAGPEGDFNPGTSDNTLGCTINDVKGNSIPIFDVFLLFIPLSFCITRFLKVSRLIKGNR